MIEARAEHVGSLLRPEWLLDARRTAAAGMLSSAELKATEDRAIRDVVRLQEEIGCPVITDGEFRRESFQSELTAATTGITGATLDAWLWGSWYSEEVGNKKVERPDDLAVIAPLQRRRSLAAEEFTFLRAITDRQCKITLPSPSLFSNLWSPELSRDAYPTLDAFMDEVVAILCDEVRELVRLGASYIQLDAPHYLLLVDPSWRRFYEARGWSAEQLLSYGIDLDNAVIRAAPQATFGFHLCRGNQGSRWLVSGGYGAVAEPVFRRISAERLLLEYDDERSGSFEPLDVVPDDKFVVLGLVTTKTPRIENISQLLDGIRHATSHIDRQRLGLGTQCGFSTSVVGNALTQQDQRNKLALVVDAAWRAFGCAE